MLARRKRERVAIRREHAALPLLEMQDVLQFPAEARQPRVPLRRGAHVHAHLAVRRQLPLQCRRVVHAKH
eukprot:834960-Prymnesium_polylepis.1